MDRRRGRRKGETDEDRERRYARVVELTRRGVSAADIAKTLDISTTHVFRIRHQRLVAKPPPRRFTAEEIDQAEAMLADGLSLTEIARTLGRNPATVNKRFPGRGWSKVQCAEFGALRWKALHLLGPGI